MLADIKLHEAAVYSVSDHKRDDLDSFWVQVRGSMLDYQINQAGAVLAGSATVPESFTEAWKFKWAAGRWVLDRIASAAPSLLANGVAYSHKLRRASATARKRRRPVR